MVWLSLLELLLPTRCAGCDLPGDLLCDECRAALPLIETRWACPRCGAPFGHLVCTECWRAEPAFAAGVCVGSLAPPLSRCVSLYKDAGERRLGTLLGDLLGAAVGAWGGWPQAVVPVPASDSALRTRGFDHTAAIALRVAESLEVPLLQALACAGARDQRALSRVERRANVEGAFVAACAAPLPPRLLLIDDVMTTGATLDAAAAVLLAAGAEVVRVGAVARAW
ncbi:MAG: ComF family protein [Coriobacteriia bacterium]|nr:ComF family protein [Coriobacteriia bacterium]